MDKARLEAFSDGMFAIIITVMVLELKAPGSATLAALASVGPNFLAYVLSFAYVGIFWSNHHHWLQAISRVDARIMWANLFLLFTLSLVPVATAWVGRFPEAKVPAAIYGGALMLSGFAWMLLQRAILHSEGTDSELAHTVGRDLKGKLTFAGYVVAIACAFIDHWVADGIYLVLAICWVRPDRRVEWIVRSDARLDALRQQEPERDDLRR